MLTNAAPLAPQVEAVPNTSASDALPDDPGQELVPVAAPEPAPAAGDLAIIDAKQSQEWAGDMRTLTGNVVIHYRDYVIRADKVVYNRATTELEAEGHLQLSGGPNDVLINATHGDMRLNMHTARFYNVSGSQGVRLVGSRMVYSTTNPLLFSGRVLLQTGENNYRMVDGSITNCRLPRPDWRIVSRSIQLRDNNASTTHAFFEVLDMPVLYLPYLHHPSDETSRVSGLLTPVISTGSSIRGFTFGEQMYWAISRSMDMVVGMEYFSKRGWAPNGDFRYKGLGLDHLNARWNGLLDRGISEQIAATLTTPAYVEKVDQGGVDISVQGRKDFGSDTRASGTIEYLSSYTYRLVFDDNYAQATSSQVASDLALTHNHNGMIASGWLDRFQSFASTTNGSEVRLLHLPMLRYDVLDRPLGDSPLYLGLQSSLGYLSRSAPNFHSRNVGRLDFYPHLSLPFSAGGWSFVPEVALRETAYTTSQTPTLTGANISPTVHHDPLGRQDIEAAVDIRPPAIEREFMLPRWHRELRHVIEPELNYRYVVGIGKQARNVLLFDTTDIATDVNEAGFSLTQRFFLRPTEDKPCDATETKAAGAKPDAPTPAVATCKDKPREWASWRIAQEYFIDPDFGGAVISDRRNVYDSTLDLTAITFLTSARNIAPLVSRLRFEAIDNLQVEWDLDYDSVMGQFNANNLYTDYSFGRTKLGIGHALLNAMDERSSNKGESSALKSQEVQPYLQVGKPSGSGFNMAVNGGYNYVQHELQYGGVQAAYNWDCCGLTLGYRRFQLGSVGSTSRDETQWLYSFTIADFGSVGDIRRTNSIFR
jgi:LPS-assembly protein